MSGESIIYLRGSTKQKIADFCLVDEADDTIVKDDKNGREDSLAEDRALWRP